jgi:hypothetical protein
MYLKEFCKLEYCVVGVKPKRVCSFFSRFKKREYGEEKVSYV